MIVDIEHVEQPVLFDYAVLDEPTRLFVQELDAELDLVLKRTAQDMGRILLKAKEGLPHGLYMSWLASKGISQPTAWRCMQVAQGRELKSFKLNDLVVEVAEPPVGTVEGTQEVRTERTTNEDKRRVVEEFFSEYPHLQALSNREIAKRCGVTEGLVRKIRKDLFPEPEAAPVSEPEATPQPPEDDAVDVVAETALPVIKGEVEVSDDVRQAREAKREQQRARNEQLRSKGAYLPPNKYACLVVDPPWEMQKIERDLYPNQVDFEYPTMTETELRAFQLPAFASDDCHLYLWTTQKHLPMALRLVDYWGFKYQCLLTWVKNVGFTPYSWMYSTEHVLFCTKGNLPLLRQGMRLDFSAKRREHSRKPDEFYDLVREASPGPRLDIFSRERRDGFDQYGNEVDKYV